MAEGILQNQNGAIHIKAKRLTPLTDSAMDMSSHDFTEGHIPKQSDNASMLDAS